MKYNRLDDSDLSIKTNKTFGYLEQNNYTIKKKTKIKNGEKYESLNKKDLDNNIIHDLKIEPFQQKGNSKPELAIEKPDLNFLDQVLDKFNENEKKQEITHKFVSKSTNNPIKPKTSQIVSEYSLFYKNDYLKNLFSNDLLFTEKIVNKNDILIKSRFIDNYIKDKKTHLRLVERGTNEIVSSKCREMIEFKHQDYEDQIFYFYDPYPLLFIRHEIEKLCVYTSKYSLWIVKSGIFETLCILVILSNSVIIFISDPRKKGNASDITDNYFLFFYTIECILKIFAFGFVMHDDSYLRDSWNILDFVIILTGWTLLILSSLMNVENLSSVSSLRTFRILRPLKTIKGIPGLKSILITLIIAITSLYDITSVLIGFFLIFSIAGLEMWTGLCFRRCMNVNLGWIVYANFTSMCTDDSDCIRMSNNGNDQICVMSAITPNTGLTSFNDLYNAFILNFITATMEGWTDFYNYISSTFRDSIYVNNIIKDIYFFCVLMVGGYYLFNLYLAITFGVYENREKEKMKNVSQKSKKLIDLLKLQKLKDDGEDYIPDEQEKKEQFEKEKFDLIEREIDKLDVCYKTINDMCRLKAYSAEEKYYLKKRIIKEDKNARKDLLNYYETLKLQGINPEELNFHQKIKTNEDNKDLIKDKLANLVKNKRKTTVLDRNEQVNYQFNIDLCKESITKAIKDFYQENYQISNANLEKRRKSIDRNDVLIHNNNNVKSVYNETVHQSTLMNNSKLSSILGDSSVSEEKVVTDNSIYKNYGNNHFKNKIVNYKTQTNEEINFKDKKEDIKSAGIIINSIIDTNKMLKNKINIGLPNVNMTELLQRKNDKLMKKKEEFKNQSLYKNRENILINKRNSFLNILERFPIESAKKETIDFKEFDNKKELDISIHKEEYINDEKLSRIDDENSIYQEKEEEFDDIDNRYMTKSKDVRNKFFRLFEMKENNYFKERKSSSEINKKPIYFKNLENKEIPLDGGNKFARAQILHNQTTHNEKIKLWKIIYKSKSIEKNIFKFPFLESNLTSKSFDALEKRNDPKMAIIREKRQKLQNSLKSYRKYIGYIHNLIETDFKINNDFPIGENKAIVLNSKLNENISFELEYSKNIFNVFNQRNLDLQETEYKPYKKFHFEYDELIKVYHHFDNVSEKLVLNIPIKSKNLGMVPDNKYESGRSSSTLGASMNSSNLTMTKNENDSVKSKLLKPNMFKTSLNRSSISNQETSKSLNQKSQLNDLLFKQIDKMDYKTLRDKFIKDEEIINQINNIKRDEIVRPAILLDNKKQNLRIFKYDLETNTRKFVDWSAGEILQLPNDSSKYSIYNRIMYKLENFEIVIWHINFFVSSFQKIRFLLYFICTHDLFELLIAIIVIGNGIIMSLQGNLLDSSQLDTIDNINSAFTFFFVVESLIKITGLGITIYFTDIMNWLDFLISVFGLVDYELSNFLNARKLSLDNNNYYLVEKQYNIINVIRIFRCFRLLKILRKLKTMKKILYSVSETISNVLYLLGLILILIIIFMLLGMALIREDPNFNDLMSAFYIVFNVAVVENWNNYLYNFYYLTPICLPYLISIIFIFNWVMINLFLAILLGSFQMEEGEELKFPIGFPEDFKNSILQEQKLKDIMKKKKKPNDDNKDNSNNNQENQEEESSSSEEEIDEDQVLNNLTGAAFLIKNHEKINKLFKSVYCEKSLYLFAQTNKFRIFCMNIVTSKNFENIILVLIALSTFRLLVDTFINNTSQSNFNFAVMDTIFMIAFLTEMFLKIISLGFCLDEGSYLRDSWNQMDLLIIIFSVVDFPQNISALSKTNSDSNGIGFLRTLRLLRTLRPLRFISHNAEMKLIVIALLDSIESILIMFIFAIAGNVLFYNEYNTCYFQVNTLTNTYSWAPIPNFIELIINASVKNKSFDITNTSFLQNFCTSANLENYTAFCANGNNCTFQAYPPFTFLNIFDSLETVFVLFNSEGWPDIMNSYRVFNNYYGLYFILVIAFGTNFFLNLFQGVIFSAFQTAYAEENEKGISDNQESQKWWDYLSQIINSKPDFAGFEIPSGTTRKFFYNIINSKYFDQFIMLIILCNMIIMAISKEDSTIYYINVLETMNYVFTGIFIVECIMKIMTLYPKAYFYFNWNKFDFFVVCASIIDVLVSKLTSSSKQFLKSFQILRVLRVLRVTRVLRLIKKLKNLEKLLQTIKWSVNGLFNIFFLLVLIYSIFAIAGCYVFNMKYMEDIQTYQYQYVNEFFNFDNFYKSIWLIFRAVTGESWPMSMREIGFNPKQSRVITVIFFFIVIFICFYVFLNLFLTYSIQQFTEFVEKSENPIEKFTEMVDHFKKAWNKYASRDDDGLRIRINLITNVLLEMEGDLSKGYKKRVEDIKKYMLELRLKKDQKNYVYFNDFLFKILKREFGRIKNKHMIIKKEENRIEKIIQGSINQYYYDQEKNGNKVTNSLNTFNPLTSHLYFKISFIFFKLILTHYKELRKMTEIAKVKDDEAKQKDIDSKNQKALVEMDLGRNETFQIPVDKIIPINYPGVESVQANPPESQNLLLNENK